VSSGLPNRAHDQLRPASTERWLESDQYERSPEFGLRIFRRGRAQQASQSRKYLCRSDGARLTASRSRRGVRRYDRIITAICNGRISDQPRGPLLLGWDRLFVPDEYDGTLAELTAAGEIVDLRRIAYEAVVKALG
jgi:hypothetical protein